jgi:hypothetical protein
LSAANVTVEAKDSEKEIWVITVERGYEGESAAGEVEVSQHDAPGVESAPHVALAASRAWLALAKKLLARSGRDNGATGGKDKRKSNMGSDAEGAMSCIRQGLEELGDSYSNSELMPIKDDTRLKLARARELVRQGRAEDGVRMMLRVLETRIGLYVELHKKHGKVRVIK